jgi:hypothetical protein
VAPVTLEEAAKHIPDHVGILEAAAFAQALKAFEQFARKAFIGRMLEREPGKNIVNIVVGQGPPLDERKQAEFLIAVVNRHLMLQ